MSNSDFLFCRKCGRKLPGDSVFCTSCGEKVVNILHEASTAQETPYNYKANNTLPYSSTRKANSAKKVTAKSKHSKRIPKILSITIVAIVVLALVITKRYGYEITSPYAKQDISSLEAEHQLSTDTSILTPSPTSTPAPVHTNSPVGKPLQFPKSGTILYGADRARLNELKIDCTRCTNNFYIKLKDSFGETVFSFLVEGGTIVTLSVPRGILYLYTAQGETWYGTSELFGIDTYYSKTEYSFDFFQYSYRYVLYPIDNPNFDEISISADKF